MKKLVTISIIILLLVVGFAGCIGDSSVKRGDEGLSDLEKEYLPDNIFDLPKHRLEVHAFTSQSHKQYTSSFNDEHNGWWVQDWTEDYLWINIRNTGRHKLNDIKITLTSEPEGWDFYEIKYMEPGYTMKRLLNFDETTRTITTLYPQCDSTTGEWHTELETTMLFRISIKVGPKTGVDTDSDGIAEQESGWGTKINGPYPGEIYKMMFYAFNEYAETKTTISVEVTRDVVEVNSDCPS